LRTIDTNQTRYKTLLVSHDVMGEKMAGPGIRYYHLSRILSRYTELTLAILPQNERALANLQAKLPDVSVITYRRGDWTSIETVARLADIVILSPYTTCEIQQFSSLDSALVLDGYAPLLIEWLTTLPIDNIEQQMVHWSDRMVALFFQYLRTDFFICASERQRYWWLGQLEVAGRINPRAFQDDPSLRNLLDVVAYGLPEAEPQHTRQVVKGVWPGIGPEDVVVLWGGGLWPWLDPLTAVQAIAQLHTDHPQLKLIFPGTIHPNPDVQEMPVHNTNIYAYTEEQGLLNKAVFFGEWVSYEDWPNVLLESDIALSLHHDSIETQLAFRSRMLEYIWAGVPMIATRGDATSEIVTQYNLGQVVDYQDVDGVVAAIRQMVNGSRTDYQTSLAAARRELTWENMAQPLIQFCLNPRRAADHVAGPVGVPYYGVYMELQRREIAKLEALVQGYENGRFMRLMRILHQWHRRWFSAS
jgi:glycosyltransferase involved in cell wall biosynthesis